ncbi:MAG: hypothetical protein ACO4AI_10640 [Prochlorothrix sp.]
MNRDNTATANRNEVNRNDHSIPIARNPDRHPPNPRAIAPSSGQPHGIPVLTVAMGR